MWRERGAGPGWEIRKGLKFLIFKKGNKLAFMDDYFSLQSPPPWTKQRPPKAFREVQQATKEMRVCFRPCNTYYQALQIFTVPSQVNSLQSCVTLWPKIPRETQKNCQCCYRLTRGLESMQSVLSSLVVRRFSKCVRRRCRLEDKDEDSSLNSHEPLKPDFSFFIHVFQ